MTRQWKSDHPSGNPRARWDMESRDREASCGWAAPPLRSGRENLEPVPVSEQGNYVVLFYDGKAGQLQTVNFRDFKFLSAD